MWSASSQTVSLSHTFFCWHQGNRRHSSFLSLLSWQQKLFNLRWLHYEQLICFLLMVLPWQHCKKRGGGKKYLNDVLTSQVKRYENEMLEKWLTSHRKMEDWDICCCTTDRLKGHKHTSEVKPCEETRSSLPSSQTLHVSGCCLGTYRCRTSLDLYKGTKLMLLLLKDMKVDGGNRGGGKKRRGGSDVCLVMRLEKGWGREGKGGEETGECE